VEKPIKVTNILANHRRYGLPSAFCPARFTRQPSSGCRAVRHGDVNYFQDIPTVISSAQFESDIRNIPGQTYGTSLKYFFMLAGEENMVKPDRMILRFLWRVIGNQASQQNAQAWLSQALQILNRTYPTLTLRKLDHEIWKYEKSMANKSIQPTACSGG
jgi:hypothetical protein